MKFTQIIQTDVRTVQGSEFPVLVFWKTETFHQLNFYFYAVNSDEIQQLDLLHEWMNLIRYATHNLETINVQKSNK